MRDTARASQQPTNPPAGHQMSWQGLAQNDQKCNFWAKLCCFRAKIFTGESKSFGTQKSIFCMVITIFVNRAHHQYARGYNFPIRTTPKISVSELWVIFRGSPLVLAVSGHSHFAITVGIGIYNGEMVSNRLLSNGWLGLDDFFGRPT